MMFAKTKRDAAHVACELMSDSMIGTQEIIYRKFVPLKVLEVGMMDLPFSNEWRFFYLGKKKVCHGYYWAIADDLSKAEMTDEGLKFADRIAAIVSEYVNFFVLDIAEKAEGGWILIEINDGQMSGLSTIPPDELYRNLREVCLIQS